MPAFVFVGERLAVDLLNTVVAGDGRTVDLLDEWTDLAEWGEAAGVVSRRAWRTPARGEPESIRRLREALRQGLGRWARTGRVSRQFIGVLNHELAADPQRTVARLHAGGGIEVTMVSQASPDVRVHAAVARSVLELLRGGDRRRLRHCANPACVLQFYDVSKGGRRRWCSMETCGARSKVRAYYLRQGSATRRTASP